MYSCVGCAMPGDGIGSEQHPLELCGTVSSLLGIFTFHWLPAGPFGDLGPVSCPGNPGSGISECCSGNDGQTQPGAKRGVRAEQKQWKIQAGVSSGLEVKR